MSVFVLRKPNGMRLLSLLFFFTSWVLSAQDSELESEFGQVFIKGYQNITTDQDSAYYYFEKALQIAEEQNNKEDILYVYDFLTYTDSYYYNLEKYKNHLDSYEETVNSILPTDSINNIDYYNTQALILKGNYYYKIKDNPNSKYNFEQLYQKLSGIDIDTMSKYQISAYLTSLNFVGLINVRQGRLNQSEYYFKNAINLCIDYSEHIDEWEERLYNNKKLLSNIYKRQGRYDEASVLLEESVVFFEKNYKRKYKNLLITSYLQISENYLLQDSVLAAKKVLDKIEKITLPNDHFNKEKKLMVGDLHAYAKDYKKALSYYNSVLNETVLYRNGKKHQDIAHIYTKLGDLERNRNRLDESLNYFQKALISSSSGFDYEDIDHNPSPQNVFSKTQLLTILRKKQEAINQELIEQNEPLTLKASTSTSKSIVATLDALRPEFESKLDKQFLIEQTYPSFHEMIQATYIGYIKTKDAKFLEDAFLYFEKSKGILLLESAKNSEAISFGTIPDSIPEKELQYRAYISNLEKKLLEANEKEKIILNDSLFKLHNSHHAFLNYLENEYPKYYELKYDTGTTTLDELQRFIETDETVISFHQAELALFTLIITKSTLKFIKIPFPENLRKEVSQFYELLSNADQGYLDRVRILSKSIYKQILAPCLENGDNINLTIIPDGLLNYIPFTALFNTQTGDYVVRHKNVRYANSATLLISASRKKGEEGKGLLTISPTFGPDSGYNPLPFSTQEAGLISNYFNGKVLSDGKATLDNFIDLKDDYSLIHFATHASANDEEPDFSYLAFASEGSKESRLYVKDLYSYNLNTKMVTLSACESGIGKLQNGEGMLSLARGFQYAGVPSLTTTLWKNDDRSTSELMGFYYRYLKAGLTKSKALQKAKLDYLKTTEEEELKHPYYWAGFVVLGDNSPISDKPISPWLLLGCVLLGTGILAFGYTKIKARRAAA